MFSELLAEVDVNAVAYLLLLSRYCVLVGKS